MRRSVVRRIVLVALLAALCALRFMIVPRCVSIGGGSTVSSMPTFDGPALHLLAGERTLSLASHPLRKSTAECIGHMAMPDGLAHVARPFWPSALPSGQGQIRQQCRRLENIVEVLVCDDHPIVASAIAMMIEGAFDASVHICHSYHDAVEVAAKRPDIGLCLLDIHIPGEDARGGIKTLQAALPLGRFMLFSGSSEEADLMLALDLQMHGFLPKSSTPQVVEAALRLVLAGGVYLPSGIGEMALRSAIREDAAGQIVPCPAPDAPSAFQPPAETIYGTLTDRQIVVLQHVSMGRSNKEIARELAISPATVKAHVAHIIALLGAANRIEAASRARSLGLIDQG